MAVVAVEEETGFLKSDIEAKLPRSRLRARERSPKVLRGWSSPHRPKVPKRYHDHDLSIMMRLYWLLPRLSRLLKATVVRARVPRGSRP